MSSGQPVAPGSGSVSGSRGSSNQMWCLNLRFCKNQSLEEHLWFSSLHNGRPNSGFRWWYLHWQSPNRNAVSFHKLWFLQSVATGCIGCLKRSSKQMEGNYVLGEKDLSREPAARKLASIMLSVVTVLLITLQLLWRAWSRSTLTATLIAVLALPLIQTYSLLPSLRRMSRGLSRHSPMARRVVPMASDPNTSWTWLDLQQTRAVWSCWELSHHWCLLRPQARFSHSFLVPH